MTSTKAIVFIPARLAATRLPNKPLADINGKTLIERVYENVVQSVTFPVYVAAGDEQIVSHIQSMGGNAVLTDPELPSGTDRVAAAIEQIDPTIQYDIIINFQGDSINVNPVILNDLVASLIKTQADITTPCSIMNVEDYDSPSCVKVIAPLDDKIKQAKCLYFTRALAPYDKDEPRGHLYHHFGVYVYTRESLRKFVSLKPGILEEREGLEQLRALENGMKVVAQCFNQVKFHERAPAEINEPSELEQCLQYIK